jgi:hypothetical protein
MKLRKYIFILFAFTFLFPSIGVCQLSEKQIDKKVKTAQKAYLKKDYNTVIATYTELYNQTRKEHYILKIANAYFKNDTYNKAIEWYNRVPELYKKDSKQLLQYAEANRNTGNYQKALESYIYYAIENNDVESIYEKAYACEELLKAEQNAVLYDFHNLPPNTLFDEIGIINYRNSFVYIANRANIAGAKSVKENFQTPFLIQREYNYWLPEKALLKEVEKNKNISHVSFTKNGNTVFYSKSDYLPLKTRLKLKKYTPNDNIYFATAMGNKWLNETEFPFNSREYQCKHPHINHDGTKLFFSSNMSGGFGGFDLYFSELISGRWSKPKNLGDKINSSFDEEYPYFSEDNFLYFSSNKPSGFGGFDLYKSQDTRNGWILPDLLPSPINSPFNDKGIVYEYGLNQGFFTSDRPGGKGGFDVYHFTPFDLRLEVNVVDKDNGKFIDYAEVQLFGKKVKLGDALTQGNLPAILQVGRESEYEILINKEGYLQKSQKVTTFNKKNKESLSVNILLEKDPKYIAANKENPASLNNPNFIYFYGKLIDGAGNTLHNVEVNLVNLTSGKLKVLYTDVNGFIDQKLFINNEYKIIFKHGGKKVEEKINTYGFDKGQDVNKVFIFKGGESIFANNNISNEKKYPKKTEENIKTKEIVEKEIAKPKEIIETEIIKPKEEIEKEIIVENKTLEVEKPLASVKNMNESLIEIKEEKKEEIVESKKKNEKESTDGIKLAYKIQLGAYSDPSIAFEEFSLLGKIEQSKSVSGQFIYTLGDYGNLEEAKINLEKVRNNGIPTAFIVCYFNNEKISIHK